MLKHEFSARYSFKYWPNGDIPPVAAGVYLIWDGEGLIYVGILDARLRRTFISAAMASTIAYRHTPQEDSAATSSAFTWPIG